MYINKILVSSISLEYEGLLTCEDREQLQEKIAAELILKHKRKIILTGTKAEFYVEGVGSKMNYQDMMK